MTYKKVQKEWVSFCDKYQFEDGDNADKLIWFTQEVVLTWRVKAKGRKQKKDYQQRAEDVDLVEEDRLWSRPPSSPTGVASWARTRWSGGGRGGGGGGGQPSQT